MPKKRKNTTPVSKKKKNKKRILHEQKDIIAQSELWNFNPKPLPAEATFKERLENNPTFVGGIYGALDGFSVGGIIFAAIIAITPTRNFYLYFSHKFFSYFPNGFVPPDLYLPGQLFAPLLFIALICGAIYGARQGSPPLPRNYDQPPLDFKGKIMLFVVTMAIISIIEIQDLMHAPPRDGWLAYFTSGGFIITVVIVSLAVLYWCFSSAKNIETRTFRIYVYLICGTTVCLIGMMVYTITNMLLYALR